jgi:hypothetical protein
MDKQLFTDGVWLASGVAMRGMELSSIPTVDFTFTYVPNNPITGISSQSMQQNLRMFEATPKLYKLVLKQCTLCQLKDHETECDLCEIGEVLRKIRGE